MRLLCLSFLLILTSLASAQPPGPDTLWTRIYAGPAINYAMAVGEMQDGGFGLVCDSRPIDVVGRGWLVRTNANGDTLWTKTVGPDSTFSVQAGAITPDGTFYIAGNTESATVGCLAKVNASGRLQWQRFYGDSTTSIGFYSVVSTPDGGVIAAGGSYRTDIRGQAFLMRTNAAGDTIWARWMRPLNSYSAHATAVRRRADGHILLAGESNFTQTPYLRAFAAMLDSMGNVQWLRIVSPNYSLDAISLAESQDGGMLVCGNGSASSDTDFVVLRLSATSDSVWSFYHLERSLHAFANVIIEIGSDKYAIAGYKNGPDGLAVYVAEIEAPVGLRWVRLFDSTAGNFVFARAVSQTRDGGFVLAGGVGNGPLEANTYLLRLASESHVGDFGTPASDFRLISIYPNPFNSTTTIALNIPSSARRVTLTTFNLLGQVVREDRLPAAVGQITYHYDASALASGIYLLRAEAGAFSQATKLVVMK